jgi:hypothetical protein
MIFRTIVSVANVFARWLFPVVSVNSSYACGPDPLFNSRGCRALSACVVYPVGGLRRPAHTIASRPSLVAYTFPDLGNSYGITSLPCPLTVLENRLEATAGVTPYQGGFLLHYLDTFVYPDISATVLTVVGALLCLLNLALYGRKMWLTRSR